METVIAKVQELFDAESDQSKKLEYRKALEILMRSQDATPSDQKPDYSDPNFNIIANAHPDGDNARHIKNKLTGPLPENKGRPTNVAPPPVEV